jgi:hypothetical protein
MWIFIALTDAWGVAVLPGLGSAEGLSKGKLGFQQLYTRPMPATAPKWN